MVIDNIKEVEPLFDLVLIAPEEAEEKTKSGIYIPRTAQDMQPAICGIVVATGPGLTLENGTQKPVTAKTGDRVLYSRFGNSREIEAGDKKFTLLRETDLLAVLRKGK